MKPGLKKGLIISGVAILSCGIGVVTLGLIMDNTGVTYTLDSDIKIEKLPEKLEIVNDNNYPGVSVKKKDGSSDYNVMVFTDLHLDHKQECCNYTFSMLARNIINEKPDLVIFCGDNVTSSYNKPRTKQFAQLLEDLGVYWAAILGNHEKTPATPNDGGNPLSISRDRMLNIWAGYSHCLNKNVKWKLNDNKTNVEGVGNAVINLENKDGGVTQSLFLLDSGTVMSVAQTKQYEKQLKEFADLKKTLKEGQTVFNKDYYDYIKDSQVDWYKETFSKIREKNPTTHSTIFSHHPLKEFEIAYKTMFNKLGDSGDIKYSQTQGPKTEIRAFTDYPQGEAKDIKNLYTEDEGFVKNSEYTVNDTTVTSHLRRREDICYSPHDLIKGDGETPIFEAIASFGDNNAFFCGHDHQNNFALKHKKVFLGYIQPACYSSNNLYTTGMLGKDPKAEETEYMKIGDHLIQGYTMLTYSAAGAGDTTNVLTDFVSKENYSLYSDKNMRERIIDYIAKTRSSAYADKHGDYKDKDLIK